MTVPTCDELALGAFLHDIGKLGQRAAEGSIRNTVFLPPRGREGEEIPVPTGWNARIRPEDRKKWLNPMQEGFG